MLIYHNNRQIKDIPEIYQVIPNITDYLEDEHTTRLTDEERLSLAWALFELECSGFIKCEENERVASMFVGAKPTHAEKTIVRGGDDYYSICFNNGRSIKCPRYYYNIAPVKQNARWVAGLLAENTPPHAGTIMF